jgi:hypothetical protein
VAEGSCRVGQACAVPPKTAKNAWWTALRCPTLLSATETNSLPKSLAFEPPPVLYILTLHLRPASQPNRERTTQKRQPRVRALCRKAHGPFAALPSRVTPSERSICLFAVGSMETVPIFTRGLSQFSSQRKWDCPPRARTSRRVAPKTDLLHRCARTGLIGLGNHVKDHLSPQAVSSISRREYTLPPSIHPHRRRRPHYQRPQWRKALAVREKGENSILSSFPTKRGAKNVNNGNKSHEKTRNKGNNSKPNPAWTPIPRKL